APRPRRIERNLPRRVHVVEERLDHGLIREEAVGGEDVERDLELLPAAEDTAVVPRRLPSLVVAEDEAAVLLAVDTVELAGDAEDAIVTDIDLEGQGAVRLSRSGRRGHAEPDLEVRGHCLPRVRRLAVKPDLHHLAEARTLALPEEGEAGRAPRDQRV